MVNQALNLKLSLLSKICLITALLLPGIEVKQSTCKSDTLAIDDPPEPLFHVNMLIPAWDPRRLNFADLIAKELASIGISTDISVDSTWDTWYWRGVGQEVGQWSEGGYDIFFAGKSVSNGWKPLGTLLGEDLYDSFGKDAIPPSGNSLSYWSPELGKKYYNYRAAESEALLQSFTSTWNRTEYKQNLKEWQKVWYDALPAIPIFDYYSGINLYCNGLYGFDFGFTPFQSMETVWTDSSYPGDQDQVIMATDIPLAPFNTIIDGYFDAFSYFSPVMDALVGKTPTKGLILPTGTDRDSWMTTQFGIPENLELYPRIATSLGKMSPDGLKYNISVRDDVYWHDGHQVDAWDVAFSFQAYLEVGYHDRATLRELFGEDSKTQHHGVYAFEVKDMESDGFFETILFSFENNQMTYLFESDVLGLYLVPEHILGDPINHGFNANGDFDPSNKWFVPPNEWQYHSFNTGNSSDPGGLNGPIGCGSLVFEHYNPDNATTILKKFENLQWANTTGEWVSNTTNDHFLIKTGKLNNMPTTVKIVSTDLLSAIEAMKTGDVNIVDKTMLYNYLFHRPVQRPVQDTYNLLKSLKADSSIQTISSVAWSAGCQWMYLNPKFTTSSQLGSDDRPFNKKGVRHAISHIVPRELIFEKLCGGYGALGGPMPSIPNIALGGVSDEEWITYKRTLKATDGSCPEAAATTALDSYDRQVALDWLETEGYNVSAWRSWTPPPTPNWVKNHRPYRAQQWDTRIKTGTKVEFIISSVRDENNTQSWYWGLANVTFHQGDKISIMWFEDPDTDRKFIVELCENITYPITVTIGGKKLDEAHSRQFGWFILPLVTTNVLGQQESGFYSVQHHFAYSFPLVNQWKHWGGYWDIWVDNDPTLHTTGRAAGTEEEVTAYIVTHNDPTIEDRVFNLTYHANSGILKNLLFTNTTGKSAASGRVESSVISGLQQLEISFLRIEVPITTTTTTATTASTTTQTRANGWLIILIVFTLTIVVMLQKRERK
ncbi:MAG: ABC transporter substrate-binding protein [Candidatus Hodarchaeota archaeon]